MTLTLVLVNVPKVAQAASVNNVILKKFEHIITVTSTVPPNGHILTVHGNDGYITEITPPRQADSEDTAG